MLWATRQQASGEPRPVVAAPTRARDSCAPWEYYLQGSAAGFAARSIHLWQFVLSPQGLPDDFEGRGGYEREN